MCSSPALLLVFDQDRACTCKNQVGTTGNAGLQTQHIATATGECFSVPGDLQWPGAANSCLLCLVVNITTEGKYSPLGFGLDVGVCCCSIGTQTKNTCKNQLYKQQLPLKMEIVDGKGDRVK